MLQEAELSRFSPVSLNEMDAVELVNRIDTKFVFSSSILQNVLNSLEGKYRILEIGGIRLHHYDTCYFDDEKLRLYLDHHNQRGQRYKLRLRRYGSSSACFMEIKKKTNKGRTVKVRKPTERLGTVLSETQLDFFRTQTMEAQGNWQFTTRISFSRMTLVSLDPPERVTLDVNLQFSDGNRSIVFDNVVIGEVKQGSKAPSAFVREMKDRHIHPFSISKYCLGLSLLKPELKHNMFKSQQRTIQEIQNNLTYGS